MKSAPIDDSLEKELLSTGYDTVIGVDEVGRGSWAGPLVVAAFIYTRSSPIIPGVNDSKKLTRMKRLKINALLIEQSYKIGVSEVEEIDKNNVLEATRSAIIRALNEISKNKTIILVDGYFKEKFDFKYKCISKGDQKHYSIAAASIIAKVHRDRVMIDIASKYPQYGFESHVGYGTKRHREAIEKYGICKIHRRSYKPIRKYLRAVN